MDIKLFDNRILAPSKCGTRHLRKIYTDVRFDMKFHKISDITHIVVRNPYEHFKSAIHTEYLNYKNSNDTTEHIHHIILNSTIKDGIGHWHPNTYQFLYSIFMLNRKIKIIELENLSAFLESEGYSIPYNESEYNWSEFDEWESKDELFNSLSNEFKNEFILINKKLEREIGYYNKLISKDDSKNLI